MKLWMECATGAYHTFSVGVSKVSLGGNHKSHFCNYNVDWKAYHMFVDVVFFVLIWLILTKPGIGQITFASVMSLKNY